MVNKALHIITALLISIFMVACVPSGTVGEPSISDTKPTEIVPVEGIGDPVYGSIQDAVDQKNPAGNLQDFDIGRVNYLNSGVENVYIITLPQSPNGDRDLSTTYYFYYTPGVDYVGNVTNTFFGFFYNLNQGVYALLVFLVTIPVWLKLSDSLIKESQKIYSLEIEFTDLLGVIQSMTQTLVYRVLLSDEEEATAFSPRRVEEVLDPYLRSEVARFSARWSADNDGLSIDKFLRDYDDFVFGLTEEMTRIIREHRLGIGIITNNRGTPELDASAQANQRTISIARQDAIAIAVLRDAGVSPDVASQHLTHTRRSSTFGEIADKFKGVFSGFGSLFSRSDPASDSRDGGAK